MKANTAVKISLFILCICMLLTSFAGCAKTSVAMQYGDAVITDHMYNYWMRQYKDYFLTTFTDAEDTAEFWNSEIESGVTMSDYMIEIVESNVKKNLVCMKLFDDFKLELSETSIASVDSDLADLIESYGSKSALNTDLAKYDINYDILRQVYIIQEEIAALYDYMYGENGLFLPSDEQLDTYYRNNYARIKYVTLLLYKSSTDENGKTTAADLTYDELDALYSLADKIEADAKAGADFDGLVKEYGQDDLAGYENGIYISALNSGYDIIKEALKMEIDEIKTISQDKAIYIVQRLPLEDVPYTSDPMGQFSDLVANCSDWVFQNMLEDEFDNITINGKIVGINSPAA